MNNAYEIVTAFEEKLGEYTGAPHVVAVDSCTNALLLALMFHEGVGTFVDVPRRTYLGVAQSVMNAGYDVRWVTLPWEKWYRLWPTRVEDHAKNLHRGMYKPGTVQCVSFHIAKALPIGRGGAVLLDDAELAQKIRTGKLDGRVAGQTGQDADKVSIPGFHFYMTPPDAARGLWLLTQFLEADPHDTWEGYPDISQLFDEAGRNFA